VQYKGAVIFNVPHEVTLNFPLSLRSSFTFIRPSSVNVCIHYSNAFVQVFVRFFKNLEWGDVGANLLRKVRNLIDHSCEEQKPNRSSNAVQFERFHFLYLSYLLFTEYDGIPSGNCQGQMKSSLGFISSFPNATSELLRYTSSPFILLTTFGKLSSFPKGS